MNIYFISWLKLYAFFLKMGHSRPIFFIFVFPGRFNFANVWLQTADLWCRKRPLYQLSHNHCLENFMSFLISIFLSWLNFLAKKWSKSEKRGQTFAFLSKKNFFLFVSLSTFFLLAANICEESDKIELIRRQKLYAKITAAFTVGFTAQPRLIEDLAAISCN